MDTQAANGRDETLTADDLPIVLDVLRANTTLHGTAYAVRLIERSVEYPIENLESLASLFREQEEIELGGRTRPLRRPHEVDRPAALSRARQPASANAGHAVTVAVAR